MRNRYLAVLPVVLGTMATAPLAAQAGSSDATPWLAEVRSSDSPPRLSEREMRAPILRARRYAERGDLAGARRGLERATAEFRARGIPAYEALWHLAAVYEAERRTHHAAATLDTLAADAGARGAVAVRVSALLEAARLYSRAGRTTDGVARLQEAATLLDSPALPDRARTSLLERLGG